MMDYKYVLKKIGLNIRAERIRKGLSQEGFAEMADVHPTYIGKIERGEQNLTIRKLVQLANSLKIDTKKFFTD